MGTRLADLWCCSIQRQAPNLQVAVAPNIATARECDDLEAALEPEAALERYLKLSQRQAYIEAARRHLLQGLVFFVLYLTSDIALCVRLWRECQALDSVFLKFIAAIAQQSVMLKASTLDPTLVSLNRGYKIMTKTETEDTRWEDVGHELRATMTFVFVSCWKMRRPSGRPSPPRHAEVAALRRAHTF